jgi:predicted nucleic acid-binding protein
VTRPVILDAGPLGAACNPLATPMALACTQWLQQLVSAGFPVIVPEIADYEVRRELLRGGMIQSIARLDQLGQACRYLPITTAAMRKAAEFWAQARQQGYPSASDPRLDADVILAAQAATLGDATVIIATTNVAHLNRFVTADFWQNIRP